MPKGRDQLPVGSVDPPQQQDRRWTVIVTPTRTGGTRPTVILTLPKGPERMAARSSPRRRPRPARLVGPCVTAPSGTGATCTCTFTGPERVSPSSLRHDYPAPAGQHGRPDGPEAHQPTNDQQAQRPDDVPPIQQMRRPLATQPVPPNPIDGDRVQHPKLLARQRPPPRPATTNRTVTHRFTDPHPDTSSPSRNPSNRTHRG